MKRALLAVSCSLFAGVAFAQTPSQARVDAIWDAAMDRVYTQTDAWFSDGQFPRCIQMLKVEQEAFPHDYDIATNLGWMQENVQAWDEALATYVRFQHENPKDPDAVLPQATFYFMKRAYPKVIDILEPNLKDNAHPNNFRMLARAYEQQKMYKDSLRIWDRYLALHPDDGQAKVNRERVQKKLASG